LLLAGLSWPRPQLLVAVPLLLAWLAGPALAWWLSRPASQVAFVPNTGQRRFLQSLARRTWAFFDQYVGPQDNWLAPDNLQEQP
ncbi:hypothetical protein, partial [Pseudomonas sp. JV245A]